MPAVLDCLIEMTPGYTKCPYTVGEQDNIEMQFVAVSGFSNVIRVIDCTRIAVKVPNENEFAYVNRKYDHSITVQIVQH